MSDANLNDPRVAADYDLIYADWDTHAERLVQLMNGHLPVVPAGTLLDCSCGSGLSLDAAQRLGWVVTGADSSPAMLRRARQRLPGVEVKTIDVLSLDQVFNDRFGAVISIGNALPMLKGHQVPQALQAMRACVSDGGAMMLAIRDFSDRIRSGVWRDDPVARVQARFVYQGGESIIYALDISDASGERTHELTLHPISPLALEAAVLAAGFRVTRTSRAAGRAVISATAV